MKLYYAGTIYDIMKINYIITFAKNKEQAKEKILADAKRSGMPDEEMKDMVVMLDDTLTEHPHSTLPIVGTL